MDAFGVEFGKALGQLVSEYRTAFAGVALLWHLSTLAVLCLVVRYGNRYRRLFAVYFALAYAWLVVFVGVWMSVQLFERMGAVALVVYGATPAFLLVILFGWLQELRSPRLDLDLRNIERWRLLVAVPMFLWGFWYPPYIFGERLVFDPAELLFGAYGLMGCPTTMVVLSLLFLTYPSGNRRLFHLLTAYAVLVGAAMIALRYVPDIPFFVLGIASVALIVRSRLPHRRGRETARGARGVAPRRGGEGAVPGRRPVVVHDRLAGRDRGGSAARVGTSGRRRPILAVVLAVVPAVVLAAGCGGGDGGTATSPATVPNSAATSAALPDENRARAVAENMLIAYNTGDYQAFSRDFAGPVKVAVGERAFTEFRAETLPVTGRFERLVTVTPTAGQGDPDHAEYDVNADFERREGAIFTMILSAQGEVEGIEFRRPA